MSYLSLVDVLTTFRDEKKVVKTEEGKYVEKDSGGVSLKGVLQRGRLKLIRERKAWPQGLTFRPSSITYSYCRRLKVAQLAGLIKIYDDKPTPKLQLVFDMGHGIHDIVQRYFWEIGILKGSFYCIKCDKVYNDLVSPKACPSGIASHDRKSLSYREINLAAPECLIKGRTDGILDIEGEEHIMDIKSIANRTIKTPIQQFCFEDLEERGPKEEHVVQLTLYMYMSGVHRGHLVYVAKNDHKIKTFAIPYNYEIIKPYLSEIKDLIEKAEKLKQMEKVVLPAPCGKESCPCADFVGSAQVE